VTTADVLSAISEAARDMLGGSAPDSTLPEWDEVRWARLVDTGLATAGTPETLGGSGGGPAEAAAVIRAVGAAGAPVPIVASTLLLGWLSTLINHRLGDGTSAVALAGATPGGEGRHVCPHVPWGRHARRLLAVEVDDPTATALVRIVPAERITTTEGSNLAGEPRDELSYVTEAGDMTFPVPGDTADRLEELDALGRAILTAGAAESVMDLLTRYTSDRVQFGQPLARLQAVQQMLAQAAGAACAAAAAADAATDALARRGLSDSGTRIAIAAAKVTAADSAGRLARLAHQVTGAIGLTQEFRLGAYTLRLKSWSGEAGDRDLWAARLGAAAAGMGAAELWEAITATPAAAATRSDTPGRLAGEA
jgi:acyl-CoA dehydrogenase